MHSSIVSLAWVGDMSAPSILPVRSSLSPEPNPVIDILVDEIGEIEEASLDEDGHSVHYQPSYSAHTRVVPPPVSISAMVERQWPGGPSVVPQSSSSEASVAPQQSTTTRSGQSPELERQIAGTDGAHVSDEQAPRRSPYYARREPRSYQAVPLSPSKTPCYFSLGSILLEQDFFTPPATRHSSVHKLGSFEAPAGPATKAMLPSSGGGEEYFPARFGVVDASMAVERDRSRTMGGTNAHSRETVDSMLVGEHRSAAIATHLSFWVPLRAKSACMQNTLSSSDSTYGSTLKQLKLQGCAAKEARRFGKNREPVVGCAEPTIEEPLLRDPSSRLSCRSKPHLLRGHVDAMDGGADPTTPLISSPSRSPTPICIYRTDSGFDSEQPDLSAGAKQRFIPAQEPSTRKDTKRADIKRLQIDNEALKQQFAELRSEFWVLKDVLLSVESRRRWRECVG